MVRFTRVFFLSIFSMSLYSFERVKEEARKSNIDIDSRFTATKQCTSSHNPTDINEPLPQDFLMDSTMFNEWKSQYRVVQDVFFLSIL